MNEALTRVIAEQQTEIDRLKARESRNINDWAAHHRKYEELAQAAFIALDSQSPEDHFHLKRTLITQGWCITCEQSPCECEGQYD